MLSYSPAFISESLSLMDQGTVDLGVPLVDGIIQIGAVQETQPGRIVVTKGQHTIAIERTDGAPIQAEIVDAEYIDLSVNGLFFTKTPVFTEPVGNLRFERSVRGVDRIIWQATGDRIDVTSRDAIKKFADTIGSFAIGKQNKLIRSSKIL
jgi:hypothetical protein